MMYRRKNENYVYFDPSEPFARPLRTTATMR